MIRARCTRTALVATILLTAVRAAADPVPGPAPALQTPQHLLTASSLHTDGGSDLRLPPGYFLPEPLWTAWDAQTRTLQDARTRLTAENVSLKASTAGWQPGWYTLASVVTVGFALGWYAHSKL